MNILDYDNVVNASETISTAVRRFVKLLHCSGVASTSLSSPYVNLEISHHLGLQRYWACGGASVQLKDAKLLMLYKGQYHPEHHHCHRDETYQTLWGRAFVICDDQVHSIGPGETLLIPKHSRHALFSPSGVVIRETFTGDVPGDVHYTNTAIPPADQRKTLVIKVPLTHR